MSHQEAQELKIDFSDHFVKIYQSDLMSVLMVHI